MPFLSASKRRRLGSDHPGLVRGRIRDLFAKNAAPLTLVSLVFLGIAGAAQAETRSLKLYFVHTGEHATITFKRNGKFDPEGLAKLNRFLRDWRRNEPTKMDPRLFDLIWSVYQKSGSTGYINVLCGYRAPQTNEMLRTRSARTGVARHSQHILGKAMDFYIPGVPLERLREIGLSMQMGGVGYYPTSGSPFVHMDVGGPRAWPRPSRDVLARLFPNGKTVYIPADGKPMPGYQEALADYKRRMSSEDIQVASVSGGSGRSRNLLSFLFGGGDEDEDSDAIAADAAPEKASPKPKQAEVQLASAQPKQAVFENLPGVQSAIAAPVPSDRPAFKTPAGRGDTAVETALVSSPARDSANAAIASVIQNNGDQQQFDDLQNYKIPVPQLLAERRLPGEAQVDVADAPLPGAKPDIQVASADPGSRPAAVMSETEKGIASNQDQLAALLQKMAADGELDAPAAVKPKPRPAMVAALVPPIFNRERLTRSLGVPATPTAGNRAGVVRKGGRPGLVQANSANGNTSSKLTGKLIAQWAVASNHIAPRPMETYGYAGSAKLVDVSTSGRPVQIDPARF